MKRLTVYRCNICGVIFKCKYAGRIVRCVNCLANDKGQKCYSYSRVLMNEDKICAKCRRRK